MVRLLDAGAPVPPLREVRLRTEGLDETFAVESAARRGPDLVLKLRGVDDPARAEGLRGREVLVPEEAFPPPEGEDAFYQFQIAGLRVVTRDGREVGEAVDVRGADGANPLLVVEGPRGEVLVPFRRPIVVSVDPAGGVLVIDPPDGLLDLNEI